MLQMQIEGQDLLRFLAVCSHSKVDSSDRVTAIEQYYTFTALVGQRTDFAYSSQV